MAEKDEHQDDSITSSMVSGPRGASGKTCLVCGDRALSCNFGAITCESCKAFFRRNAAKEMWGKCDGKCPVTVETRSYCKKCRLEKCYTVGMKKELILNDHQKQERRQKILENRLRRQGLGSVPTPLPAPQRSASPDDIDPRLGYVTRHYEFEEGANADQPPLKRWSTESGSSCGSSPQQPSSQTVKLEVGEVPYPALIPHKLSESKKIALEATSQTKKVSATPLPPLPSSPPRITQPDPSVLGVQTLSQAALPASQTSPSTPLPQIIPNIPHAASSALPPAPSTLSPADLKPPATVSYPMPIAKETSPQAESPTSSAISITSSPPTAVSSATSQASSENSSRPSHTSPTSFTHSLSVVRVDDLEEHMDKESLEFFLEIKKAFSETFDKPVQEPIDQAPSFTDFFNLAELPIKRLVKMAKLLTPFRQLKQDDQIALLKGSVVAMVTIRSAKLFNPSISGWNVVRAGKEVNLSSISLLTSNMDGIQLFNQYRAFVESILTVSKCDDGILMMLIILCVFNPDIENVEDKEIISHFHTKYTNVLRQYIDIKYPEETSMFKNVMDQLEHVNEVKETHSLALQKTPPDRLQPLIVEIFDMCKYGT